MIRWRSRLVYLAGRGGRELRRCVLKGDDVSRVAILYYCHIGFFHFLTKQRYPIKLIPKNLLSYSFLVCGKGKACNVPVSVFTLLCENDCRPNGNAASEISS